MRSVTSKSWLDIHGDLDRNTNQKISTAIITGVGRSNCKFVMKFADSSKNY